MHKTRIVFIVLLSLVLVAGCKYDNGDDANDSGVNANQDANTTDSAVTQNDANPVDSAVNNNNQNNNNTNPPDCNYHHDSSLSAGETGEMSGMTEQHDYWRFRVGVPLASWNAAIAAHAQAYVDTCPSGHSSYNDRQNVGGFSYVGENIYYHSSSSADPVAAVAAWASERADYDYGTPTGGTSAMVGHYTQIVWDSSIAIGCGVARCSGSWGTIVVCQYGPGGNMTGATPYDWVANECVDLDNDDVLQGDDSDDTDRNVN